MHACIKTVRRVFGKRTKREVSTTSDAGAASVLEPTSRDTNSCAGHLDIILQLGVGGVGGDKGIGCGADATSKKMSAGSSETGKANRQVRN